MIYEHRRGAPRTPHIPSSRQVATLRLAAGASANRTCPFQCSLSVMGLKIKEQCLCEVVVICVVRTLLGCGMAL